jgi:hypothetical protein
MLGLMILGLAYVVFTYLNGTGLVRSWGQWNLAFGFGLILVGFGMTTRWR